MSQNEWRGIWRISWFVFAHYSKSKPIDLKHNSTLEFFSMLCELGSVNLVLIDFAYYYSNKQQWHNINTTQLRHDFFTMQQVSNNSSTIVKQFKHNCQTFQVKSLEQTNDKTNNWATKSMNKANKQMNKQTLKFHKSANQQMKYELNSLPFIFCNSVVYLDSVNETNLNIKFKTNEQPNYFSIDCNLVNEKQNSFYNWWIIFRINKHLSACFRLFSTGQNRWIVS